MRGAGRSAARAATTAEGLGSIRANREGHDVKRTDKAIRIQGILDELYPSVPIPLDHEDPYSLLIAVLLSAQCTDVKVNQITPLLFAKAATPQAMVKLTPDAIREIIRPCGLSPAKSKAIHRLSEMLLENYDGEVPPDLDALEELPGVGHKTASVVIAQAFGVPAFPVDTHIHRLAARWGLSSGRNVVQTERDLKLLFDESRWNDAHLQIIHFGRDFCPARGHDLSKCRICGWAATKKRIAEEATKLPKRMRAKSQDA